MRRYARMTITTFENEHRFLSNFWLIRVQYHGKWYPSVEHAYQAAKFYPHNPEMMEQIRLASTPAAAKRLGRHGHIRDSWDRLKLGIMEELLREKFKNPTMRNKLLATGDQELVEGNWWGDKYWGVCPAGTGTGENHLGKLLMKIREELRT